jgi:thiol-disulfide isomerase/thioredoxin
MQFLWILLLFVQNGLNHTPSDRIQAEIRIVNTSDLLKLIEIKDDTVRLFNFWATWCRPCVKELQYFEELNQLKKNDKFKLYLVSLDFKESYHKKLLPFITKRKLKSEVLLFDGGNPNSWIDLIEPRWGGSIPASLIVHKGKRCFAEQSFDDLESLRSFINNCKFN